MPDTSISGSIAASALAGPELFAAVQSGGNVKVTSSQIRTWAQANLGSAAFVSVPLVTANLGDGAVTNSKLADMASNTFKGRQSGSGVPQDLTVTEATALLNTVTGDSGSGGVKGLVPAPTSGDTAANKYLKASGAFETLTLLSVSPSAGVGYATGAGGTVTQATNKSTGVTLNKTTGTITMNNAALNAGVAVGFTVTNSSVAATDVVIVNIKSGATADSYNVTVDAVAAGSFRISIRNHTGGNLSEAIVLSFAVIKGVAA